jgi:hypothetical protein
VPLPPTRGANHQRFDRSALLTKIAVNLEVHVQRMRLDLRKRGFNTANRTRVFRLELQRYALDTHVLSLPVGYPGRACERGGELVLTLHGTPIRRHPRRLLNASHPSARHFSQLRSRSTRTPWLSKIEQSGGLSTASVPCFDDLNNPLRNLIYGNSTPAREMPVLGSLAGPRSQANSGAKASPAGLNGMRLAPTAPGFAVRRQRRKSSSLPPARRNHALG